MKKIAKIVCLLLLVVLFAGCGNKNYKEISFKELNKKLANKDSFILIVVQDGCSNCEEYVPKFKEVLKEYDLTAYSINLTKLTQSENTKLENIYNVSGTPTVLFIEKGEEPEILRRIVGNTSSEKTIRKLKTAGYIK